MTQLIAPPEITIQTLPYSWKGKQRMVITLMLATPIDHDLPYSTQDAWTGIMEVIPKSEIFDLGYPKPRGEVLVYGSYYAPNGYAITADKVNLEAGTVKKELAVSGERLWRNILTPTTPEPFRKLPLTYEYGAGGEEEEKNPIGKGFPLNKNQSMPQLEYPDQLLTDKHQKPAPAGLNAVSVDWMPRKKLWGTYDTAWQEQDAPFLARDLNTNFFMQAAADQWFEGYIQGGESIRLDNMDPIIRSIKGQTPHYRFRVLTETEEKTQLHTCQIDTLILLPDINMQVLLARTELPINSIDGNELTAILAAYENNSASQRDQQHYNEHLILRRNPQITDEEILNYSPMRPENVNEPLTPLSLPQKEKSEIAKPGVLTLTALAAAGGFASKMAIAAAKSSSSNGSNNGVETTSNSSEIAESPTPLISPSHAEQAANAIKVQMEALGFSEQELNDLMQAPPEQVPHFINLMLAKHFPDQPQADPDSVEDDPVVKEELTRTAKLVEESSISVPKTGNIAIDNETARVLSKPGQTADFNILTPQIERQLNQVSEELSKLYDAYPGDKSELDQPSDIGTKAIIQLLKGL
ncbi:DUF2169 family type VI secretion system accessory protein [Oceanospirillum maris]|uniref:DUF2169 family type VI secretion system accessory protein n=1 Tax=Oceanospirillum maris TaxID=64977 RepID=UPI00040347A5|nr:DUF2169 domain-containing protein [Oceanospirillum maris]